MHKSRLAGFIIDCKDTPPDEGAAFWKRALGLSVMPGDEPSYVRLDARARDLVVEVQNVAHDSRVHLDIESDDVEASRGAATGSARCAPRAEGADLVGARSTDGPAFLRRARKRSRAQIWRESLVVTRESPTEDNSAFFF